MTVELDEICAAPSSSAFRFFYIFDVRFVFCISINLYTSFRASTTSPNVRKAVHNKKKQQDKQWNRSSKQEDKASMKEKKVYSCVIRTIKNLDPTTKGLEFYESKIIS